MGLRLRVARSSHRTRGPLSYCRPNGTQRAAPGNGAPQIHPAARAIPTILRVSARGVGPVIRSQTGNAQNAASVNLARPSRGQMNSRPELGPPMAPGRILAGMADTPTSSPSDTPVSPVPAKPQRIPVDVWDFMSAEDKSRVAFLSEEITKTRDAVRVRLTVKRIVGPTTETLDAIFAPVTGGKKTDLVQAEDAELEIRLYDSELNEIMWRVTHEFNQRRLADERERNDRQLEAERREREAEQRAAEEEREKDRRETARLRRVDRARVDKQRSTDTALAVRNVEANETAIAKSDRNAQRANWVAATAVIIAILTLISSLLAK